MPGGFSIPRAGMQGFLADYLSRVTRWTCLLRARRSSPSTRRSPLSYLDPKLQKVVDMFEPFGEGNPHLSFLTRGLRVAHCELIGRRDLSHLKLLFDAGKVKWPAVYWNAAQRFPGEFAIGTPWTSSTGWAGTRGVGARTCSSPSST